MITAKLLAPVAWFVCAECFDGFLQNHSFVRARTMPVANTMPPKITNESPTTRGKLAPARGKVCGEPAGVLEAKA